MSKELSFTDTSNDARSDCSQVYHKDLKITIHRTPSSKFSRVRMEQFKEHCNGGANAVKQCTIWDGDDTP